MGIVDIMSCSLNLRNIEMCINGSCLFKNINLNLGHKDKVAIVGANGCGKTTLLKSIVGLIKPFNGSIEVFHNTLDSEKDFVKARKHIGFLFQDPEDQIISPTVIEEVSFGLLNERKSVTVAVQLAEKTLAELGIYHLRDRITLQLSGGEKKLVALASILIMEPDILLLDEPSASLDKKTEAALSNILRKLDKSILMVSHNEDFVKAVGAKKLYFTKDGLVES